ncbi:BirA family biotin operon repressor/biotin-[acetyl-CoA-carboxylase] ligase [Humibacillus xanthopallidus]|uniref:biotin--[biotin carboxyl-carrier protein] ligase n=1 Tax=Humibacillus xanthopallidus TaxID=412689 RepID=A0A543PX83_9MICO|nr:biotin--[acetyl-CoA-carboxylase] ligase [Humibacillus xanthopallidus]TQN48693.1 BirA family biotin operon repressor/biotin-[acetyl-CoA-carboxylase] ligase [Humibacillus xanthopallidus]
MRDSLDAEIVGAGLVTSGQPWRGVEFHAALASTNTRLRELVTGVATPTGPYAVSPAARDGGLWWVVLTDHQTGGRGRLGRVWEVPDRASVAVSCAVPVTDPAVAGWLPLLAGLALSRALRVVSRAAGHELDPRLKWPNDVLLGDDDDRKVSGILCELVAIPARAGGARETAYVVVVGTGVNVDQARDELPVDTATSLALAGAVVRREDVVVAYLRELAALLRGLDETASPASPVVGAVDEPTRAAYVAACSTVGARVRVHLPGGQEAVGDAVDIDRDGGLVVVTAGGRRTFAAGDVVHVRRP